MERLQKILAEAGLCSRRAAENLIRQGRVTVGGQVATLGQKADPAADDIRLDGRPVAKSSAKAVFLFHKPKKVVTTLKDPQGRPCLAQFLAGFKERLFPVGRLDYDTAGLLILTNDGDLAQRLAHPRFGAAKTYLVTVRGRVDERALGRLKEGVILGERPTAPARVEVVERRVRGAVLRLTIHEGRNHQVKRMCRRVGLVVADLVRLQIGPLALGDLAEGQLRPATAEEMRRLGRLMERSEDQAAAEQVLALK
jgi:23S rRNA pseudouridine2605 synthase